MPMFKKSDKAMSPGKPSSSLAFALNAQRFAKKKKFAQGGEVAKPMASPTPDVHSEADKRLKEIQDSIDSDAKSRPNGYAKGGMVDSIADAVMHRLHKKMAEGGMVDLNANSEETPADPSPYDDQNEEAAGKESYDLDQLSDEDNEGTKGDELEDADENDRISAIRKRMKK